MGDAFGGAESGTQCGQTFVRVEGKLLAVSARNPVAPSMALMRQVPLEILLQNSEVNTSLIKTQLLARLEGRSSLKNLEPYLFAEEGSPVHDLRYRPVSSPVSHLGCPELLQLSLPGRKHISET
ncbi:DNA repair protein XRCC2 isoform X5 [Aphelocoma coerulescens]|uniref:DNA repair protein XRCC2 isoform X5 n=1 Tax=Aphelocoma coerulescens TaxID=39617 RepID=UPI0036051C0B